MFGTEAAIHRGVGGFQIENACLVNGIDESFTRQPPVWGNGNTWTLSGWFKFNEIDRAQALWSADEGGSQIYRKPTNALALHDGGDVFATAGQLNDTGDWTHVVVAINTTLATASDRIKIWFDGVRQTDFSVYNVPQNLAFEFNSPKTHRIGANSTSTNFSDMYMAELVNVNAQQLDADAFGEWNKKSPTVWQPKDLSQLDLSGNTSYYLNFADPNDLGKDVSGKSNSWGTNGINSSNHVTDTPTNNACTLNPLSYLSGSLSNGNRRHTISAIDGYFTGTSTMSLPPTGKWYAEVVCASAGNPPATHAGVTEPRYVYEGNNHIGMLLTGPKYIKAVSSDYGVSWENKTLGIAVDRDAKTVEFYVDGAPQGVIAWPDMPTDVVFGSGHKSNFNTSVFDWKFNPDEFAHTPPADFLPLTPATLPNPAVANPKKYFDPVIYTGDYVDGRIVPTQNKVDHVIIKQRTGTRSWQVWDNVRNGDNDWPSNTLVWDATSVEALDFRIRSGGDTGFMLGPRDQVNREGFPYVAYPFTRSPIAGMDIVAYEGDGINDRAVPHILGVAPDMFYIKSTTFGTGNWAMWFDGWTQEQKILLNTSDSRLATDNWGPTPADASNVYLGTTPEANDPSHSYVMYLFKSIYGFSHVFHYFGNSSANGPFVHCGFKPAFVMLKRRGFSGSWRVFDIKRNPYNPATIRLEPDTTAGDQASADSTTPRIDLLSNGFKLRTSAATSNIDSDYIGIAFAENPFGMRGK